MSFGRSRLLLLWGALAVWSPLLPVSGDFKSSCTSVPNETKRCGEPKPRFFYNVLSKSCELFTYYGCPGNPNSYDTLEECVRFCGSKDPRLGSEPLAKRRKRATFSSWKRQFCENKHHHHYHHNEWIKKKILQ